MFTGIIQRIGRVRRISRGEGLVLEIGFDPWPAPLAHGESVAVNGVCLTVAAFDATHFTAHVLRETESRSTLAGLKPGARVNLERAVRAGEPLGGHIVSGHVDARGRVAGWERRGRDRRLTVCCGAAMAAAMVEKGSIAIDGVSLTVTSVGRDRFSVDLIPTTLTDTILGDLIAGDEVNLENDALGKYARRAVAPTSGGLTEAQLRAAGFCD